MVFNHLFIIKLYIPFKSPKKKFAKGRARDGSRATAKRIIMKQSRNPGTIIPSNGFLGARIPKEKVWEANVESTFAL